jgi:hypothetical protein
MRVKLQEDGSMDWKDLDRYLIPFPIFTQAQCDGLATISADIRPSQVLEVKQTRTHSGGLHLYARKPNGDEFHIARNGNIHKMGVRADAKIRT